MRINHNISASITQGSLFATGRNLNKSLEKLSTGLRINRAADDAAGLGISERLRAQIRGTAQAQRNALDGIAAMNIAEGAANEVSTILQRMRELAIQSANDTLTDTERGYTDQEYDDLLNEIDRIANVTNYNGKKLLANNTTNRFGQGSVGSVLWVDANDAVGTDSITITINTLSSDTNGLSVSTLSLASQTSAQAAIATLDMAITSVNTMRANIGATVNRLEHAITNLSTSNTNQQSAESVIRDVDFANETTNFTKNQILIQSATAMLAQANIVPQSVLQLLG